MPVKPPKQAFRRRFTPPLSLGVMDRLEGWYLLDFIGLY